MIVRYAVPWRPDGGRREQLWSFCRTWWSERLPEAEIVEGSSPDGPFNRSAAINAAASGRWDVLVVMDADIITAPEQVRTAISRAKGAGLVMAFDEYRGLNASTTAAVLGGAMPANRGIRFRSRTHVSSLFAVDRDTWERSGGFDERFRGWGCEDVAFARSCGVASRVSGPLWHLWHPNSPHKRTGQWFQQNRRILAEAR